MVDIVIIKAVVTVISEKDATVLQKWKIRMLSYRPMMWETRRLFNNGGR